jgi:glycosyltransferase involved in cell wall biosynthesis
MLSVVILTFNSSKSIARTIASVGGLADEIVVLDSFSSDHTVELCEQAGCKVFQRAFSNYADQRNWAIEHLPITGDWELHLDADEEITASSRGRIREAMAGEGPERGFLIERLTVFMGKLLRFGGHRTWHCRLFRRGAGRCENRLYDQHFVCAGATRRLRAVMLDHQEASLSDWTSSHNRWSDMEAEEIAGRLEPVAEGQVDPQLTGDAIQRRRYYKGVYYRLPLFGRALAYFLFKYVVLLGFLDGARGFIFYALQGLWFRLLVDAKIYERRRERLKAAA